MSSDYALYWEKYYKKVYEENLFWFSPYDIEEISKKFGVNKLIAEFIWRWTEHSVRTFENLQIKNGDAVLEIGAGTGGFTYACILRNQDKKFSYTAVDFSDVAIKTAKKRGERLNLDKKVHFLVADALKLPFPDNSFDVIICPSVLEHIPDQITALQEMRRVCKSSGKILISTDNKSGFLGGLSLWTFISFAVNLLKSLRIINRPKGYFIKHTKEHFLKMLFKIDLKPIFFEYTHFSLPFFRSWLKLIRIFPFLQGIFLIFVNYLEKRSRNSNRGWLHLMFIVIVKKI